jgi:hypothetical protein
LKPEIGRTYAVVNAEGNKLTRKVISINRQDVMYTIKHGEVRLCTLEAWSKWAERAS